MTHDRFALDVRGDQLREGAIAAGQALVLKQVFCPRGHDEGLEIGISPFEIAKEAHRDAPSRRLTRSYVRMPWTTTPAFTKANRKSASSSGRNGASNFLTKSWGSWRPYRLSPSMITSSNGNRL